MSKCYDGFTKEELIKLLHKQDEELAIKKYGLTWDSEKEPEQVVLDCENNLPILKRIADKEIKTDTSDYNILIEGDNYHALTVLNYTHKEKIDVIYIDPPYNTGNKDFKYNDCYVDKEDGYRHSKWLNFMEKRLKLAHNLLKDEGVIFISINNYEFATLKMLCDAIFNENNFLGHIIWESTTQPINAGSAKFQLQQKTESIYCYAKNKKHKEKFILEKSINDNKYPHNGKHGACRFEIIEKSNSGQYKRDTMQFPILGQFPREGKRWQIGLQEARKLESMGKLEIVNGIVKKAIYPEDEIEKESYVPFWSLLKAVDVDTAQKGKELLNSIIGFPAGFDTVKPIKLIGSLLKHFPNNITILDFFAGSGTTGHAVLNLNNCDNGKRKFILCTNNEKEICEKICYPRIEKIVNGYKTNGNGDFIEGLGGNLQYYKTDLIPVQRINKINDSQREELTLKAGEMIAIKENCFNQVELNDYYQIFENNTSTKRVAIYFREDISEFDELVNKLGNTQTTLYIFSYGRIDKKTYSYLNDNISIEDVPEPILEIYKEINLTLKD